MSQHSAKTPTTADLVTLNRAATVARLLSGAAHEVNNALQIIGGTAELLQVTPGLPLSVLEGLQRTNQQTARAAVAISEVLLFARQRVDERGRVNLRDVATRSASLRSFAISRARLTLAVDAPARGHFIVRGSAPLLQLVMLNLLVNAEQALAGCEGGTIQLSLEEQEGQVVVSVSDNGPGVDPAAAAEIFEPFVTTRSRDDASGLGLAVARLVAEEHGGTLVLEPRDAGATFVMRLPVAS